MTSSNAETTGDHEPFVEPPNAVLVGGPLAGRAIVAPALDQPVRIEDGDGVVQEYRPAQGVTESVDGQPVDLAVFHHYMPV